MLTDPVRHELACRLSRPLRRLGYRAVLWHSGAWDCWMVSTGPCEIGLHADHILVVGGKGGYAAVSYADPGWLDAVLAAVVRLAAA